MDSRSISAVRNVGRQTLDSNRAWILTASRKLPCSQTAGSQFQIVGVPVVPKFDHKGLATKLDISVNYIYSNWLTQSDQRHTYGADLEFYGEGYHPTSDASVIGYAIPIE